MTALPPELPTSGPTAQEVQDAEAWATITNASTNSVTTSAEKWRDGLAALVSLITGGLIIAGPDSSDLASWWRYPATGLIIIGLGCAATGFFLALTITAGRPTIQDLPTVTAEYGSVANFKAAQAAKHVGTITTIQRLAIAALTMLLLGAGIWMAAPAKADKPDPKLSVTVGKSTWCGELKSADRKVIVLQVEGEKDPRTIRYDQVTNFEIVEAC